MAEINPALGVDLDRNTGALIYGWAHVEQCLGDLFTTRFGERVMREWYGSLVPAFLGQNMNEATIVRFFAALTSAIDQFEPRFKITQINPLSVNRDGSFHLNLDGDYRPLALVGNLTSAGSKRVRIDNAIERGLILT